MENKTLSIGGCLKKAWHAFTHRFGFWAGLIGISIAIFMIPGIVHVASPGQVAVNVTETGVQVTTTADPMVHIINSALYTLLGVFVGMGWTNVALRYVYGEEVSWGDFWRPLKYGRMFFSFLVAGILYSLILLAGLMLFVFPAFIWASMFMMWPYYVVRHQLGPIQALKAAAHTSRGAKWDLFALLLVLVLLSAAGIAALLIGALVVYVIEAIAKAEAFKQLYHETTLPPELDVPPQEIV